MPLLRIEQIPSPNSNRKFKKMIVCSCDTCDHEFSRGYQKSLVEKLSIMSFCSRNCMYKACRPGGIVDNKKKLTSLDRYGVDHPSKLHEVIEKIVNKNRETCMEKYGVENFGSVPGTREKIRATMIENYGVTHSFNIDRTTSRERAKETLVKKHGVEYPMQAPCIREKRKKTCLERYGVEAVAQSEAFKQKFRATMLERHGVENPLSDPSVRLRIEETCLERYGVRFASQSLASKEASKETCKLRYGVENQMQSAVIKEKVRRTNLVKYGVTCVLHTPEVRKTVRQRNSAGVSKKETDFFERLARVFEKVDRHVNVAVENATREVDYYIHDIECFVNYNGTYWHGKNTTDEELASSSSRQSEGIRRTKRYDAELVKWFNKNEQNFMVVWEDEEDEGFLKLISLLPSDPSIRKQKILGVAEEMETSE